jgi:hypothetical protein
METKKIIQFEASKTVSFRPTIDDAKFLNENIHLLIPEDTEEVNLTFREIFMYWAEKTASKIKLLKQSTKEDLDLIEKLNSELDSFKEIQLSNVQTIEKLNESNNSLSNELALLKAENDRLKELLSEASSKITENDVILNLTPLEIAVTNAIRSKTAEKRKKEVTIKDIIFSVFWLYHITQEWEYSKLPFILTKREIKEIERNTPAE